MLMHKYIRGRNSNYRFELANVLFDGKCDSIFTVIIVKCKTFRANILFITCKISNVECG